MTEGQARLQLSQMGFQAVVTVGSGVQKLTSPTKRTESGRQQEGSVVTMGTPKQRTLQAICGGPCLRARTQSWFFQLLGSSVFGMRRANLLQSGHPKLCWPKSTLGCQIKCNMASHNGVPDNQYPDIGMSHILSSNSQIVGSEPFGVKRLFHKDCLRPPENTKEAAHFMVVNRQCVAQQQELPFKNTAICVL